MGYRVRDSTTSEYPLLAPFWHSDRICHAARLIAELCALVICFFNFTEFSREIEYREILLLFYLFIKEM